MLLRRLLVLVPVVAVGLASIGCSHNRVKVKDTRGPDGSAEWHRVSCKRMDKKCFQTARAMCPDGYIFTKQSMSKASYEKSSSDKEKRGSSEKEKDSTAGSAATPQVGVNVKTLPPEEKWGDEMYSKKPGMLMIRCAEPTVASKD